MRIIQIENGNDFVDFIYYDCVVCGCEIPENYGGCFNNGKWVCYDCSKRCSVAYLKRYSNFIPINFLIEDLLFNANLLNNKRRRYIPKKTREKLLENAVCKKCGAVDNLEIDHIVPISLGGTNYIDNLQVLCKKCNLQKGAKLEGNNE